VPCAMTMSRAGGLAAGEISYVYPFDKVFGASTSKKAWLAHPACQGVPWPGKFIILRITDVDVADAMSWRYAFHFWRLFTPSPGDTPAILAARTALLASLEPEGEATVALADILPFRRAKASVPDVEITRRGKPSLFMKRNAAMARNDASNPEDEPYEPTHKPRHLHTRVRATPRSPLNG